MPCRFCGKELPLFKKLADNEFCSAEHRESFVQRQHVKMLRRLEESAARLERRRAAARFTPPEPPDPNPAPAPLFSFILGALNLAEYVAGSTILVELLGNPSVVSIPGFASRFEASSFLLWPAVKSVLEPTVADSDLPAPVFSISNALETEPAVVIPDREPAAFAVGPRLAKAFRMRPRVGIEGAPSFLAAGSDVLATEGRARIPALWLRVVGVSIPDELAPPLRQRPRQPVTFDLPAWQAIAPSWQTPANMTQVRNGIGAGREARPSYARQMAPLEMPFQPAGAGYSNVPVGDYAIRNSAAIASFAPANLTPAPRLASSIGTATAQDAGGLTACQAATTFVLPVDTAALAALHRAPESAVVQPKLAVSLAGSVAAPSVLNRPFRMKPRVGINDSAMAMFQAMRPDVAEPKSAILIPGLSGRATKPAQAAAGIDALVPPALETLVRLEFAASGVSAFKAYKPVLAQAIQWSSKLKPNTAHSQPVEALRQIRLSDRFYRMRPRVGVEAELQAGSEAAAMPLAIAVKTVVPVCRIESLEPPATDKLFRMRPRNPIGAACAEPIALETGAAEPSDVFVMPPVPELKVVHDYNLSKSDRTNRLNPPGPSLGSTGPRSSSKAPGNGTIDIFAVACASLQPVFPVTNPLKVVPPSVELPSFVDRVRAWFTMPAWLTAPALRYAACGFAVVGGVLTFTTMSGSNSSVRATAPRPTASVLSQVKTTMAARSAIQLADDFRSGLSQWEGAENWSRSWNYDQNGGVRPGALALWKNTTALTNYTLAFTGQIEKNALGFVTRAADLKNCYAVKLEIARPGPTPVVDIVRYAIIDGQEQEKIRKRLPLNVYEDTVYSVRMSVQDSAFVLEVNGKIVDTWSNERLLAGGIGFFSNNGEGSRILTAQVSHQDDTVGKALALVVKDTAKGNSQ